MVRVLVVVTLAVGLAWSAVAGAQVHDPNAEAARLAQEATEAYEAGDLDGAIALFKEAMDWVPDPAFAFNLAYIYEELGLLFPAYRYYQIFLDLYPGAPNRGDVVARRQALEALFEAEYAELRIDSVPSGAAVWVDVAGRSEPYGETPLTAWVPPGRVAITAELGGYLPESRALNAVAGVRLPLQLDLVAEAPDVEPSPLMPWSIGLLAAGTVALGTGFALWIMADGDADDYETRVDAIGSGTASPSLAELRDLGERAEDRALVGNVLAGVGAALLAGGAALLVLSLDDASSDSPGPVVLRPSGLGLEIVGRY